MPTILIRDARPDETQALQELTIAAYHEYATVMPAMWPIYRQNIITTLANVAPAQQIVAELDGLVVGTALLYPPESTIARPDGSMATRALPEIRLLAVAPETRGKGVGKVLMEECIRRARESGVEAITLHTTDMMAVAMSMYERMGFKRASELDFHPNENVTVKGYRFDLNTNKLSPIN